MKTFTLLTLLLSSALAHAQNAAMVKVLKGDVYAQSGEKQVKLKMNDWVQAGAIIKTDQKSFVRLVFIDKSVMNVSPASELKIERFDKKDAGVLGLVRGQIRSQVTKDYLQIQGKDRSKLFIKTSNAVMGIRGTDFLMTTNGKNTAAILFEGEVVFNRLTDQSITDSQKLEGIVDTGVRLFPGEFSAVGQGAPTIPALLNVNQRVMLEKGNSDGGEKDAKSKSVVPPGLSATHVTNRPAVIQADPERKSSNPEGFAMNGQVKPMNGSLVDLNAAVIVAPPSNAKYDSATNTYASKEIPLNIDKPAFNGKMPEMDDKMPKMRDLPQGPQQTPPPAVMMDNAHREMPKPSTAVGEQIIYSADDYKKATGVNVQDFSNRRAFHEDRNHHDKKNESPTNPPPGGEGSGGSGSNPNGGDGPGGGSNGGGGYGGGSNGGGGGSGGDED
jgi:hypothetical protein